MIVAKVSDFRELNADVKVLAGAPAIPDLTIENPALCHNLNGGTRQETLPNAQL